jgi:hypothetical protein
MRSTATRSGGAIAAGDLPLVRALSGEEVADRTLVMRDASGADRVLRASCAPDPDVGRTSRRARSPVPSSSPRT